MAERARIATYFAPLTRAEPGSLNLTDDAAILTPPPGKKLVVTTDSVIEAIHILPGASPAHFAQKLLRRNLSDLAAMGAVPWRYSLNLHTPQGLPDAWFAAFAATLAAEQTQFNLTLIGGDSTSGAVHAPIHCTLTCFGLLDGDGLLRTTAQAGDDLYVSGTIGDAALGLNMLQQNPQQNNALTARYHLPEPRLALGQALHGIASAAIDISDGLLADISQLCTASKVGVQLQRDAIPRAPQLQHALDRDATLWNLVLSGGDDYELCFTAPPHHRDAVARLAQTLAIPCTRIGTMTSQKEICLLDEHHQPLPFTSTGFEHR